MSKMPAWADMVLIPLISLILAGCCRRWLFWQLAKAR